VCVEFALDCLAYGENTHRGMARNAIIYRIFP
jgi:hypothetical protein